MVSACIVVAIACGALAIISNMNRRAASGERRVLYNVQRGSCCVFWVQPSFFPDGNSITSMEVGLVFVTRTRQQVLNGITSTASPMRDDDDDDAQL